MISLRAAEPRHRRCPGSPQTRRPRTGPWRRIPLLWRTRTSSVLRLSRSGEETATGRSWGGLSPVHPSATRADCHHRTCCRDCVGELPGVGEVIGQNDGTYRPPHHLSSSVFVGVIACYL